MTSLHIKNKGITLIEIMVALVVVSLGLLGLAKFQTELTRNAASTKVRTAALALAEQKLEDLRSFSVVPKPSNASTTIEWSSLADPSDISNVMAFDYITSNAGTYNDDVYTNDASEGGRLIPFPPCTNCNSPYKTGAGENLYLTWDVNPTAPIGDSKEVLVNVLWDGLDGTEIVQLSQILSATNPGVPSPLNGDTGTTIDSPTITYNPGNAPEIINIDVDAGGGLKKETSKPLPDVYHNASYTKSTFEVVTYNSPTNTVVRREQFINVNCECSVTGTGTAFTPAHVVFENGSETIHDQRGTLVTKTIAEPSNNQQPLECGLCCRDHTDPSGGYTNSAGETILYGASEQSSRSGTYADSCRLKYVDGILSVFQDWNLKTLTTMSDSYLSDTQPTTQALYRTYVSNYVTEYADSSGTLPSKPDAAPASTPTRSITLGLGASKQLLARGVYIDNVYNASNASPSYSTFINDKIANGDNDTLQFIPFTEVNLTKLANWTSNDASNVDVTSEAIVDETASEDNYSRGLASADPSATPSAAVTITASVNSDNSGIVGLATVAGAVTDDITATVDSSIIYFSVSGEISFCAGLSNSDKGAVYGALQSAGISYSSAVGSGTCTVNNRQGNTGSYSCDQIEDTGGFTDAVVSFPAAAFPTPSSLGPYNSGQTTADVVICDS